jgi:hypothetical protein
MITTLASAFKVARNLLSPSYWRALLSKLARLISSSWDRLQHASSEDFVRLFKAVLRLGWQVVKRILNFFKWLLVPELVLRVLGRYTHYPY